MLTQILPHFNIEVENWSLKPREGQTAYFLNKNF